MDSVLLRPKHNNIPYKKGVKELADLLRTNAGARDQVNKLLTSRIWEERKTGMTLVLEGLVHLPGDSGKDYEIRVS